MNDYTDSHKSLLSVLICHRIGMNKIQKLKNARSLRRERRKGSKKKVESDCPHWPIGLPVFHESGSGPHGHLGSLGKNQFDNVLDTSPRTALI